MSVNVFSKEFTIFIYYIIHHMYNCHTKSHVDLQLVNVFSVVENIFKQHLFAYFY